MISTCKQCEHSSYTKEDYPILKGELFIEIFKGKILPYKLPLKNTDVEQSGIDENLEKYQRFT